MSIDPESAPTPSLQALTTELDRVDGVVSVWCGSTDRVPWFVRAADQAHYAASTMKLPVLVAAHRLAEAGRLDLDAPVTVHNEFASALDGSPYSVDHGEDSDDAVWDAIGTERPLRWLVRRMTVRSSNLATNLVLDEVGTGAVAEVLQASGSSAATTVGRGIEDYHARDVAIDNVVTAADLAAVLCALARRSLVSDAATRAILDTLAENEWNEGIPAGLPAGVRVCHKSGWQARVCHDAALLQPVGRAESVLVVLTTTDLENESANALTARIAAAAWADQKGSQ
ncbi:MAG TPA: serine hydrolase [Nocardioidaceae bacterium]|nr:serine hydrolase [Nocardioidaceae bacterium]